MAKKNKKKTTIQIVTDTDANLPQDIAREYGIEMAAIHIIFGNEDLLEECEIGAAEGYQRMAAAKELPKTSQPSSGEFVEIYKKILDKDPDTTILSVHVSGGVSGTVASAQHAIKMLPDANIHVFDTRSVSLGEGLMALEAARMARDGANIEAILETLRVMRDRAQVMFAVKSLKNLVKGGRISHISYLMANTLDIKPLLRMSDGMLSAHSRHRTWKRALSALSTLAHEEIKAALGSNKEQRLYLAVVHAHNEAEGRQLADDLNEALKPSLLLIGEVGLGLGVHSGPDALGISWVLLPKKG